MTSVLDHTAPTASTRRRLGAATAALALLTTGGLLLDQSGNARAATAIGWGAADSFAVLGGAAIDNTGTSVVTGDIGSTTITGDDDLTADDILLTGAKNPASTAQAQLDAGNAYTVAAGQGPAQTIPVELAPAAALPPVTPGVYSSPTFEITNTMTLDAQGDPDAVFVFKAASTLVTGSSSKVLLTGGAQACNVYWQVGSSATLGTNSTFVGNILAYASVTLTTGADVVGRLYASTGTVTLDSNTVTRPGCSTPVTSTPTPPSTPSTPATPTAPSPDGTPGTTTPGASGTSPAPSGRNGSPARPGPQVSRVPVGSVDAGDGSSVRGTCE
ncbi:Protein of unknown function [Blastococcus fimeti]|nr:Protein of unknown function [Blastococcus fimeti]